MKWRKPDDFPKETGEQLCEIIRKKFGTTTIYPTYVKFIAGENYWLSSPEGYGVHRWLDESTPPEKSYSEEEVMELIAAFKISETYPMPVADVKDEFTNLFKANLVKVKNWFREINKQ